MVVVMALGGSTNAVLHLIAMARAVDVPLTIDDFQKVSDRIPFLADLKPSGKYVQEDLHNVGGTPAVMKYLLEKGLLDGDCLTVTGKTLGREPGDAAGPRRPARTSSTRSKSRSSRPATSRSCAAILRPTGPWPRSPARKACGSPARPRSTTREEDMLHALEQKKIAKGDVVDHSLRRPQGRPGHARDAHADLGHHGRRPGQGRGADHRRPLLRRLARLHRRPRHARGPGRRADRAGAKRRPDHDRRRHEPARRRSSPTTSWPHAAPPGKRPPYKATRGTLYKYIKNVKSASEGCVTDE